MSNCSDNPPKESLPPKDLAKEMSIWSFLPADRLLFGIVITILAYIHYVIFIENTSDGEENSNNGHTWRYYTWYEFENYGCLTTTGSHYYPKGFGGSSSSSAESSPSTGKHANDSQNLAFQLDDDGDKICEGEFLSIFGYIFNVTSAPQFYRKGEGAYSVLDRKEATRAIALSSLEPVDVNRGLDGLKRDDLEEAQIQFETTYLRKYPIMGRVRKKTMPWMKPSFKGESGKNRLQRNTQNTDYDQDSESPPSPAEDTSEFEKINRESQRKTNQESKGRGRDSNDGSRKTGDDVNKEKYETAEELPFKPFPFKYDPTLHTKPESKKTVKKKGKCPMRKVHEVAARVVRIVANAIPRLMR